MRIFDENKEKEIFEYDTKKYHTIQDKILVHHDAIPHIPKQSHYEVVAEYPNGGKDVVEVIDVEGQEGREGYDDYEDILVIVPYTEEEKKEFRKIEIRTRMNELSQDFIQTQLGAKLDDLDERKAEFIALHNELRQLLGKEPRIYE